MTKAQTLLKQLLFGLESSLSDSTNDLNNILTEKFEMTLELNDKKIQLKCGEIQQQIEVSVWHECNLWNLEETCVSITIIIIIVIIIVVVLFLDQIWRKI